MGSPPNEGDHVTTLLILAFLVLVGPLGAFCGRDSRVDDVERRHRYRG
jgi:hypothetical protein